MEGAYPRVYPGLASPDCVLDLAFDEGSGQQVVDASQHANHGAMLNMEEGDWVVSPGGRGFAVSGDGVAEIVRIPSKEELAPPQISIVAQVQCDKDPAVTTTHTLCDRRVDVGGWQIVSLRFYGHAVNPDLLLNEIYFNGVPIGWNAPWPWQQSVYYGIGFTFENGNANDYIDGSFLSAAAPANVPVAAAPWVLFGAGAGASLQGKVGKFQIFNRVLQAPEILRLYEQPRARYDAPLMIGHMGLAA